MSTFISFYALLSLLCALCAKQCSEAKIRKKSACPRHFLKEKETPAGCCDVSVAVFACGLFVLGVSR